MFFLSVSFSSNLSTLVFIKFLRAQETQGDRRGDTVPCWEGMTCVSQELGVSGSTQCHRPYTNACSVAVFGKDEQTEKTSLDFSLVLMRISMFSHAVQQIGF